MASTFTLDRRAAGVLLHLTSLPGPHGIGDLGPAAERFAGWLADAGQSWWQVLPIAPPGGGGVSPYYATSAFAGNPLILSLELLAADGWLTQADLDPTDAGFVDDRVEFGAVHEFKLPRLRKAFRTFEARASAAALERLHAFRSARIGWLPDFALFCAVKDEQGGCSWVDWPTDLRTRMPAAMARARERLAEEIRFQEFLQFQFVEQWARFREACHRREVGLIGDIPIFVAHDSADVWSNPDLFWLDDSGRPLLQAGVPPDYFSKTGQLWGNPLYRWDRLQERRFDWWLERIRTQFSLFDVVRIDHFIGFHRCWAIPGGDRTAERGRWMPVPGTEFFTAVEKAFGKLELIAEDLGLMVPEVEQLRDRFGFPGMTVLQFAFGADDASDAARPHGCRSQCVAYTGTHDNDTTVGWFRDDGTTAATRGPEEVRRERETALLYLGTDGSEIHWDMIRTALQTPAGLAVYPMQDVLGLGAEARMNVPGRMGGDNWQWRLRADAATAALARRLRALTKVCGRNTARQSRSQSGG